MGIQHLIGDTHRKLHDFAKARALYDSAFERLQKLSSGKDKDRPDVRLTLADCYNKLANIKVDEANGVEGTPSLALDQRLARYREALALYGTSFDLLQRVERESKQSAILPNILRKEALNYANRSGCLIALYTQGPAKADKKLLSDALSLLETRITTDQSLFDRDPTNIYFREALALGHYNLSVHLLGEFNDPKRALVEARIAVTLTQERNRLVLDHYRKALKNTDAKETARIDEILHSLREPF